MHTLRPEELCITNELISESMEKNCGKEWRSQREFLDYLEENKDDIEWKVIGNISTKTMEKWNILPNIKINEMRNVGVQHFWILVRGKSYYLVDEFVY